MTKPYYKAPTKIDQAKITGKMSKKEQELAKWFLDKEWNRANESGGFTYYHNCMGWIFCNGINSAGMSVLDLAFTALGTIKDNAPEAYQNFMTQCKKDLDRLEPEATSGDIVPFPAAGGAG